MGSAGKLREILAGRIVFLDGASGTLLYEAGMHAGATTELWAMENPEAVRRMHREYADAGADICHTCTFGGVLAGMSDRESVARINAALARLAVREVGDRAIVAASIGPTGLTIHPHGELRWIEAWSLYCDQVRGLVSEGIEVFICETFSDPRELKAAVLAIRDTCPDAFISAQMSFGEDGLSLAGTSPTALAVLSDHLDVDAVGANCSVGPESLLPVVRQMAGLTAKPVSVEPNAGLPVDGRHIMEPAEFARWAEDLAWAGAGIIGGCCGTGPDHIREMVGLVGKRARAAIEVSPLRALTSIDGIALLGRNMLAVGESLNPTGRPALRKAIRAGDFQKVVSTAREQHHADIIDVNLGLERVVPEGLVTEVFSRLSTGPPLSVDLSSPSLLEEAFRETGGVALLNSLMSVESDIASKVEILKRHGGYAVLLPIDEEGLGETAQHRLEKLEKGLAILKSHGFPPDRIIADPIVKAVATGARPGETVETLGLFRDMGLLTVAGVSNVSHGLPRRRGVNNSMLSLLAAGGLDLAIIDVLEPSTLEICRGSQVLSGRIDPAEEFDLPIQEQTGVSDDPMTDLKRSLVRGDGHGVEAAATLLLGEMVPPAEIVENGLAAGMEEVGRLYSSRKLFLPHLIAAADAAESLMKMLVPLLGKDEAAGAGTVVIASVRGDIHDIGKNLVALFLRNSGFRVIDLGKDVPSETIVGEAVRNEADIIALSALMSTTAPRMEEVIELVRDQGLAIRVIVGGAVVTEDYADAIGAHGYASDAWRAVETARKMMVGEDTV
jgi:5-methyltetrahydrofolate--homocysteine methyltransferase